MAAALVVAMSGAMPSYAFVGLQDVKFDGSLEVTGNSASNESDLSAANDHRGGTHTRVRVGMDSTVTDGVKGRLELVREPRQYGTSSTSVNTEQDKFKFENAYVSFDDLIAGFKAKLGRQYQGEEGDLVNRYGLYSDDSLSVSAIDGLLLQCRHNEKVDVDLFVGKESEDDASLTNTDSDDTTGDKDFISLDSSIRVIPEGRVRAAIYSYKVANSSTTKDEQTIRTYRLGVNGNVMDNKAWYRAEYFQNAGDLEQGTTTTKYKGRAFDLGFGGSITDAVSAWITYTQASGDKNTTDSNDKAFRAVNSDRYFGEIFGRSNTLGSLGKGIDTGANGKGREIIGLGAQFKPSALDGKSRVRLDYYILKTAEKVAGTAGNTDSDKLGNEIDLTLGYDKSENVGFEAGWAMLSPDKALQNLKSSGRADEEITKLFARAKIKWGGQ